MKTLIADSGASKTDWAFLENGKPVFLRGSGLHPAYLTDGELLTEIRKTVGSLDPSSVRFFGAGCFPGNGRARIRKSLEKIFGNVVAEVGDDLTGAGRSLIGENRGIVCALGTGSICGRYRNGIVTDRSAAMGYAMGDEGSAAHIGKNILKHYFRNQFDEETARHVKMVIGEATYPEMMEKVYGDNNPALKLGKIAGQVLNEQIPTQNLQELIRKSFEQFADEQLMALKPGTDELITFTGKSAIKNPEILLSVLSEKGFNNVKIGGSVIEGLAGFYK